MRHGLFALILTISLFTGGCAAIDRVRLTEIHYSESRLGQFSCEELKSQYGEVIQVFQSMEDELRRRHDGDQTDSGFGSLPGAGVLGRLLFKESDGLDMDIRKVKGIKSAYERAYSQRC